MKTSIIIGIITNIFWIFFLVFLFYDLYLTYHKVGFFLKTAGPFILLTNILGIVLGIIHLKKQEKKKINILGIILNLTPILVLSLFYFWLFFMFKM